MTERCRPSELAWSRRQLVTIDFFVDGTPAATSSSRRCGRDRRRVLRREDPVEDLTGIDFAEDRDYRTTGIVAVPGLRLRLRDGWRRRIPPLRRPAGDSRGTDFLIIDWAFQTDPGNPELFVRSGGRDVDSPWPRQHGPGSPTLNRAPGPQLRAMPPPTSALDGRSLTIADVVRVAREPGVQRRHRRERPRRARRSRATGGAGDRERPDDLRHQHRVRQARQRPDRPPTSSTSSRPI